MRTAVARARATTRSRTRARARCGGAAGRRSSARARGVGRRATDARDVDDAASTTRGADETTIGDAGRGVVRRRTALWTLGAGVWARRAGEREARAADATTGDEFAVNAYEDLTVYRDRGKKFLLKFPKKWTVGSKPGAAVLFKNPDAKYSNIGVTVSPVTVKTLDKFGSLNEIGNRLANAEQAKESTVPGGVTLTRSDTRVGSVSGTTFYDYEYRLITTYGNKRVTTSVTIVDSTLYILNAQFFETADPERPTDPQLALDQYNLALHRKVAESFDAGKAAFPSFEIEAEELRGEAPMIADGMGK